MSSSTPHPAPPGLLIAGATGLVGHELARQAAADAAWQPVYLLMRRAAQAPADTRVLQVDFTRLSKLPAAGSACCALGTTIAVAGSQPAFRAVDFDAVVHFARAAHRAGVKRFAMVSALGASAGSAGFYNRIKGEAEEALVAIGFQTLVIARPSLLAGNREALAQPARRAEQFALALTRPLSGLIPKAWRPIEAATVARAMLRALHERGPGHHVIESAELQSLGQEMPS